jgi:hypothetical protein
MVIDAGNLNLLSLQQGCLSRSLLILRGVNPGVGLAL